MNERLKEAAGFTHAGLGRFLPFSQAAASRGGDTGGLLLLERLLRPPCFLEFAGSAGRSAPWGASSAPSS